MLEYQNVNHFSEFFVTSYWKLRKFLLKSWFIFKKFFISSLITNIYLMLKMLTSWKEICIFLRFSSEVYNYNNNFWYTLYLRFYDSKGKIVWRISRRECGWICIGAAKGSLHPRNSYTWGCWTMHPSCFQLPSHPTKPWLPMVIEPFRKKWKVVNSEYWHVT